MKALSCMYKYIFWIINGVLFVSCQTIDGGQKEPDSVETKSTSVKSSAETTSPALTMLEPTKRSLPKSIVAHLQQQMGMNDEHIERLDYKRMPEKTLFAVVDQQNNICFVYLKTDDKWINVFWGTGLQTGWTPTTANVVGEFISLEADLIVVSMGRNQL